MQQATLDPENADRYARLVEEFFDLLSNLFEVSPEAEE